MKMHQVQNSEHVTKQSARPAQNLQTNINKSLHDDGACVVTMQRSSNRERKKSAKAVAADELVEKRKIAAAAKKAKKKKKEEGGEVRKEVAKAGAKATSNPKSSKRKPRKQPGGRPRGLGRLLRHTVQPRKGTRMTSISQRRRQLRRPVPNVKPKIIFNDCQRRPPRRIFLPAVFAHRLYEKMKVVLTT